MDELSQQHCVQVIANTPRIDENQARMMLAKLTGWRIYEKDGEPRLEKSFNFEDFKQAMSFSEQVAQAANTEDHHPAILTEYGKVTITWWTHKIKGLHLNDFIMAAKTDRIG